MRMTRLRTEEYIAALEKMRKSPRDRIGILGDLGVTVIGATAGGALAGTLAGAAGATTLMGSSTAATLLGGIFVTATPVGWVIGTAAAGGVLGFGIARLVRSGGQSDARRKAYERELKQIIAERQSSPPQADVTETEFSSLINAIEPLIRSNSIPQKQATRLLDVVINRKIAPADALALLEHYHQGAGRA